MNSIDHNFAPTISRPAGESLRGQRRRIPCVLMRGGTSRGPYFLESDLPGDPIIRDRVLLAAMGSPHPLQLDGLGGANPLTSKVAIVSPATVAEADVDYLFAQVSVLDALVDTGPNCGNMLSGVAPFAIDAGLVEASDPVTKVKIFNRNTSMIIEATVQTPGGIVDYEGETLIDGVSTPASIIRLSFGNAAGAKCGALFPTGQRSESIGGVDVTLIDYAMPMMLVRARDLGLAGDESPAEIDANAPLFARLENMRREAGRRMGLGDVTGRVIPKIGILSPPRRGGTITSRYLVPDSCHRSHSATGALCISAAVMQAETIADDLSTRPEDGLVTIEHPAGNIQIAMTLDAEKQIERAELVRTARRIFEGHLLVPAHVFTDT